MQVEIDTEGVMMLNEGAELDESLKMPSYAANAAAATTYISRGQYYEIISEYVARAKQIMFERTQKLNLIAC